MPIARSGKTIAAKAAIEEIEKRIAALNSYNSETDAEYVATVNGFFISHRFEKNQSGVELFELLPDVHFQYSDLAEVVERFVSQGFDVRISLAKDYYQRQLNFFKFVVENDQIIN